MLSKETIEARKALEEYTEEYEKEFMVLVEDNKDFSVEILKHPDAIHPFDRSSPHAELYIYETYNGNALNEIKINRLLKKNKSIDSMWLKGYRHELPISLSGLFEGLENIKFLKTLKYFKKNEYKNIKLLDKLEKIELAMYDANDIDFLLFGNLNECIILMDTSLSTKEEIESSKQYIKEIQDKNCKIEFSIHIN